MRGDRNFKGSDSSDPSVYFLFCAVTVKERLSSFEGLVAAVDASCWIHKAIAISYKQYGDDQR